MCFYFKTTNWKKSIFVNKGEAYAPQEYKGDTKF